MSDFDEVLERLVMDPAFRDVLRADPDRALAGYRLQPQERAVLDAQLDAGTGGDRMVEARISKSGIAGNRQRLRQHRASRAYPCRYRRVDRRDTCVPHRAPRGTARSAQ